MVNKVLNVVLSEMESSYFFSVCSPDASTLLYGFIKDKGRYMECNTERFVESLDLVTQLWSVVNLWPEFLCAQSHSVEKKAPDLSLL